MTSFLHSVRFWVAGIASLFSLFFGVVMVTFITILQILFFPYSMWINPFKLIEKEYFTNIGCTIVCSTALTVISITTKFQETMESHFCKEITKDEVKKEKIK